jgi:lysophospholipase L1-like esterase
LLWRLQNGEVDGLHPKVAVVLIGTNNTNRGKQTAEQARAGIDAVVAELQKRLPMSQILLLGILPSGISPEKTQIDQTINRYLADKYAHADRVTFLDIGHVFYLDGKLNEKFFCDTRLPNPRPSLHPDTVGQRMMAEAIEPVLARLLGEKPIPPEASEAKAAKD